MAVAALALGSCRPTRATPKFIGDFRGAPSEVDPAFAEDWDALQRAIAVDPGSAEVAAAADRLLARGPALDLRLWAIAAKAEHAYRGGDDGRAIDMVDQAMGAAEGKDDAPIDALSVLARVRVRALVRSGDPARGLVALDEPALARDGILDDDERVSLRAVGLDRAGRHPEALAAYLAWRSRLETGAAAAYAESRVLALSSTLGLAAVGEVKGKLDGAARACLDVMTGAAVPDDAADWVVRCRAPGRRIGLLLPRTGPLSALADAQLAAAVAAAEVLAREEPAMGELLWQDSGSDAKSAADGAAILVAEGASVIVGPIGADNVRAAAKRVGKSATVHVPGESVGEATGSAPSLEARVNALVDVAVSQRADRIVVLVPDNGYGKRVSAAAKSRASAKNASASIVVYPTTTTSFAPVLDPVVPSLGGKTAVLVGDQIQRTELLVRQLARDGKGPSAGKNAKGTIVLATAEGMSDVQAAAGHDVLGGLWVAPAAAPTADTRAFTDAYQRVQGEPPSDQALLVFRALQRAAKGGVPTATPVHVARVEGGRLVVQSAPSG